MAEDEFLEIPHTPEQLLNFYEARCAAAMKRGSSLIMAIPRGLAPECVAINLELTQRAMLQPGGAAHIAAIESIFAKSLLGSLAPCMQPYTSEDEDRMGISERIMRHGYARDRVVLVNKIKKTLLNEGKIGASNEFLAKQVETRQYMKDWFQRFEEGLSTMSELSKPSEAILIKRKQWQRLLESDPDALWNQVTLAQGVPVQGTTRLMCEALATDVTMELNRTFEAAKREISRQEIRDTYIGTETFVSLTFPPEEHELIVAAAGQSGGVAKTRSSFAYPAHVTFHSPTGEPVDLAAVGMGNAPNSLFTGDSAVLLATVHSLAAAAKRDSVLLEHA